MIFSRNLRQLKFSINFTQTNLRKKVRFWNVEFVFLIWCTFCFESIFHTYFFLTYPTLIFFGRICKSWRKWRPPWRWSRPCWGWRTRCTAPSPQTRRATRSENDQTQRYQLPVGKPLHWKKRKNKKNIM